MSDAVEPMVAAADDPSSGATPIAAIVHQTFEPAALDAAHGSMGEGLELMDRGLNGGTPVRKTRSGTSSSGSSMKPSLSSRLENLKISTIRQHYYPEGGWGWVICTCAFLINMLTHGLLLSYGILYREVIKEFGEEYSEQAMWLGSLSVSVGLFLSPLIVALCRRKSTRLTAVFGGLTAALGCLFTSFASQMHQVFLSYGFVMALGLSLARVTSHLMIGQYFKRRREKVEAIVCSGTGCGVVVFSYSFNKIIRLLGWRLGLHAVTGLAVVPFFVGICYRSASLYHPQRRAILHLKNQRKKIKDKSGHSDKPPIIDWAPLRNSGILVTMLAAALLAPGLYAPFFHLLPLASSDGIEEESLLLLQSHLGASFTVGCWLFGILLVRKNADCIVGRQNLCQGALLGLGAAFLSAQAATGYRGFVLFAWMYGLPCGGLHYSLKMLVFEKIRAKSFSRAWSYVEWAQSVPVLVGIPSVGYISGNPSSRTGFYFSAACCFAGAAALLLNNLTRRYPLGRRRGQGSCSTCTSQSPSCCCTQEFHLPSSHQGSSSGHPRCQKTISFSDTVDVAEEDSPRPYPYMGRRFQSAPNVFDPLPLDEAGGASWEPPPFEGDHVDPEEVDENVVICYDDGRPPTVAPVVVLEDCRGEEMRTIHRFECGHRFEEEEEDVLVIPGASHLLPKRQMSVIEEVTSSV